MIRRTTASAALAMLALAACAGPEVLPGRVSPDADLMEVSRRDDGRCFGRTILPAVIETVTEQVRDTPTGTDDGGTAEAPATFRTVTRQRIVRERREVEFEAICPEALTTDYVASLQRALIARGLLEGPATGLRDGRTLSALRRYQVEAGGPDSPVIARSTAVALGLAELRREEIDALHPED